MRTYFEKPSKIKNKWILINARGLIIGRLASIIARYLRGKHKTTFTPHMDCGDNVIVINAEKVRFTGNKMNQKCYHWHTGYPGGIKSRHPAQIINSAHPERLITKVVQGMITRSPLGRKQMSKLKVYVGEKHPHVAQQPNLLDISAINAKNTRYSDVD
ncbi:ribosomal protein L13 [Candidatus Endolissoclinum faulkneri L5]|uniref:Large ribosomal subunit protein uL13 n=1 Tax=Candidatus Endolissoclinum faulkneri L5 TaxID=1401328 RepID=V9TTU6_9PROT|nr:ribosomal protein L13 [Candidatus Endolissoclinum faulkneri L5]